MRKKKNIGLREIAERTGFNIGTVSRALNGQPGISRENADLERCAKMIEKLGIPACMILLRADSGHDSANFIAAARRFGFKFLIKRNLRKESREEYLDDARSMGYRVKTRKGKKVYRYIDSHSRPEGMEGIPMFKIVEVIVRYTDAETGESYLIPQLEVDTWWTNLPDSELECINLYHAHGTSEQYHSEIKSDIGLELFPSGKFSTNALLLNIATLAFNALRTIGRLGIEKAPVHYERNRMRLSFRHSEFYVYCLQSCASRPEYSLGIWTQQWILPGI